MEKKMKIYEHKDKGLLIIRVGIALLFLYAGIGKLFGVLGGPGLTGFSNMVWGSIAIAVIVALIELLAGIGVLIGAFFRTSTTLLAIIILGALFIAHFPSGDIINILIHISILASIIGLALIGPGEYSILKL